MSVIRGPGGPSLRVCMWQMTGLCSEGRGWGVGEGPWGSGTLGLSRLHLVDRLQSRPTDGFIPQSSFPEAAPRGTIHQAPSIRHHARWEAPGCPPASPPWRLLLGPGRCPLGCIGSTRGGQRSGRGCGIPHPKETELPNACEGETGRLWRRPFLCSRGRSPLEPA